MFSLLPRSITRSEWPWLACVLPGAQRKKVFLKFYDINSQRRALWGIINYKPLFKLKWYSWDFIILLITDNHIRFSIFGYFSDVIDHWIILSIVKTVVFLFEQLINRHESNFSPPISLLPDSLIPLNISSYYFQWN